MSDKPSFSDYDKGTEFVKPITNPQAWIMRDKARAAAARGEYPNNGCPHPVALMNQYVDDDLTVGRKGEELNVFECGLCHSILWLVDPYGNEAQDG
jgi:hypothetical protein